MQKNKIEKGEKETATTTRRLGSQYPRGIRTLKVYNTTNCTRRGKGIEKKRMKERAIKKEKQEKAKKNSPASCHVFPADFFNAEACASFKT